MNDRQGHFSYQVSLYSCWLLVNFGFWRQSISSHFKFSLFSLFMNVFWSYICRCCLFGPYNTAEVCWMCRTDKVKVVLKCLNLQSCKFKSQKWLIYSKMDNLLFSLPTEGYTNQWRCSLGGTVPLWVAAWMTGIFTISNVCLRFMNFGIICSWLIQKHDTVVLYLAIMHLLNYFCLIFITEWLCLTKV